MEPRRDELLAGAAAADAALKQRFERRGRLAEQLQALADDRQLARKQLDLAIVQQRLDEAVRRWQVLAATCRTLDLVRATFEQQRQPETLQEASGYLQRLTEGRYGRVWTPLGGHVLRVDDAEGHALPVEALSRGTREQLFLSLRLALAACYARRGAVALGAGRRAGELRHAAGGGRGGRACAILPPPATRCWSLPVTSTCCGCSNR